MGSFVGGNMFKSIGSIESFKILTVVAFVVCVVQIIVNQLIQRFSKNDKVKDQYRKVVTNPENIKDDATVF